MNRHRFVYTLPSQNDSSYFIDTDNVSDLSSLYSYPENVWPQVISPEVDGYIPYYFHQSPFFQYLTEPYVSDIFVPSLSPDSSKNLHDFYLYNSNFSDIYNCTNFNFYCDSVYGGENITEDLSLCSNTPVIEKLGKFHLEEARIFPRVTNYGAVAILLRHLIRVDISPFNAVYITNPPSECIAAVNGVGDKSSVIHPNGRALHIQQDIHMLTLGRKAKICNRGIIFSSEKHCLSYLVDDSGTKTTSEKFRNLNHDFSVQVFYHSRMAGNTFEECHKMVNEAKYKKYKNGDEIWMVGDIRIKQDERGDVKITRNGNRYIIKTSPTFGEISVKTPSVEITIGRYSENYFNVRKDDKQVSASLNRFIVKYGSQKSGFNSSGKVALF